MTIENQIRDEKLQYDIKREASKISPLSSSKIDKYEYLTGEEILSLNSSVKLGHLGHFDPHSTNTIFFTNPMGSSRTL